jgi:hypothetical protein
VGHGGHRLEQEQAFFRHGGVHTPAGHLLDDPRVVALWIIAEEREHEAVLAAGGAVAGARIATGAEKDRHDIAAEARWRRFFRCGEESGRKRGEGQGEL